MMSTVLCLGDSITYGYPYGPAYSWVGLAARKAGLTMYNLGLNGDTTAGMLSRFLNYIRNCSDSGNVSTPVLSRNKLPDGVIITGGANDAWLGCGIGEVQHNIAAVADHALGLGMTVFLGITVPLNFEAGEHFISPGDAAGVSVVLESYKSWMRDFAFEKKIQLIDFHACLADPATNCGLARYYADNIHPNRDGYRVMAETAAESLSEWSRPAP